MKKQLAENVAGINKAILTGKAPEVLETFSAPAFVMQENDREAPLGKRAILLRRQEFFRNRTALYEGAAKPLTLAENRSVREWFLQHEHRKFQQGAAIQQGQDTQPLHAKFCYGG